MSSVHTFESWIISVAAMAVSEDVVLGQPKPLPAAGISRWLLTLAAFVAIGSEAKHEVCLADRSTEFVALLGQDESSSWASPHPGGRNPGRVLAEKTFSSKAILPKASVAAECPNGETEHGSVGTVLSADHSAKGTSQADTTFAPAAPTWQEPELTLTVDTSFQTSPSAIRALEAALNAWTSAASELPVVNLRFADQAYDESDPEADRVDHRIYYAPRGDKRANGALAITVVTVDEDRNAIVDADIIVNGMYRFSDMEPNDCKGSFPLTYDLQDVLTHEIGHWFGLAEDYCNPDATMYAYTRPSETIKRDLAQSDIVSAQIAYWQADNPSGEVGCSFVSRSSDSAPWNLACAAAAALWIRLRRSESAIPKQKKSSISSQLLRMACLGSGAPRTDTNNNVGITCRSALRPNLTVVDRSGWSGEHGPSGLENAH